MFFFLILFLSFICNCSSYNKGNLTENLVAEVMSSGEASPAGADDDDFFLLPIVSSIGAEVFRISSAVNPSSESVREVGFTGDDSHSKIRPNHAHLRAIDFAFPTPAITSSALIDRFLRLGTPQVLFPRGEKISCDWLWLPARHIATSNSIRMEGRGEDIITL